MIKTAEFVLSNTDVSKCPAPEKPEYAFIGRSNVGKSSLINMLTGHSKLAKTSGRPGKTTLINHFIINQEWYLVDLPGYGYAKASKQDRKVWSGFIKEYILKRENLMCLFVLIDSRHEPMKIDLEFMEQLGLNSVPFAIAFTKSDKLSKRALENNMEKYRLELLKTWEDMPVNFITSAETSLGKDAIVEYIEDLNKNF